MQVYFITGAGGGIGQALSLALLDQGKTVIATDIRGDSFADLMQAARSLSGLLDCQCLDVCDALAFEQLLHDKAKQYGQIDCLINNAGIMSSGAFSDVDLSSFERIMQINLMGVVNGSKVALKQMQAQAQAKGQGQGKGKWQGCIANVASTAGITPVLNSSAYAASKHAVVGFTRSLAGELRHSNIRVSLIIPGLIDTPIFDRAEDVAGCDSRAMAEQTPINKFPAAKAAQAILLGLEQGQAEIVFPRVNRILLWAYRLFPKTLTRLILANQHHQS